MKIRAKIVRISFTGNEAIISVLTADKWQVNNLSEISNKTATGNDYSLEIDIRPYKSKRSIEQNRLMWEMLSLLSEKVNNKKDSEAVWNTYCEMLLRFGQRAYFYEGLPETFPILQQQFRATRIIEERESKGKKTCMFQVFEGSSKFNTKEMTEFIGSIQSELAELGVKYENISCL